MKCNYKELYKRNLKYIYSFNKIYICTVDKDVVFFFKSKKLNIYSFTTFPTEKSVNLHHSNIKSSIKIKDLFADIFIATNSKKILSVSKGGFITLLRNCFNNKKMLFDKLN